MKFGRKERGRKVSGTMIGEGEKEMKTLEDKLCRFFFSFFFQNPSPRKEGKELACL